MLTKKNAPDTLLKLSSYIILLLLSQPAAAIPSLYSTDDFDNEMLIHELTTFSPVSNSSQQALSKLQNPQQAKQVLQNLEHQFRETGELRNIIALAPRITELLPNATSIKYLHAIALAAKGDTASAQQIIYQQKKKNGSNSTYAFMALATVAKTSGKLSEASAAANKAISIDAEHPYPYNLLGQIEAARQNYAKALANFQTAVRYAPKFAAGWSNLGAAQLLQDDPATAETSFSTAIKLSPNYCAPRIDVPQYR